MRIQAIIPSQPINPIKKGSYSFKKEMETKALGGNTDLFVQSLKATQLKALEKGLITLDKSFKDYQAKTFSNRKAGDLALHTLLRVHNLAIKTVKNDIFENPNKTSLYKEFKQFQVQKSDRKQIDELIPKALTIYNKVFETLKDN